MTKDDKIVYAVTGALVVVALGLYFFLPDKKHGKSGAAEKLSRLSIDYANWNPLSLVLKKQAFLEKELDGQGVSVDWVFSQGSNKSMELLRSNSVDVCSSASISALIGRLHGSPLEVVYISTSPEWVGMLVRNDSDIAGVRDLKGRTVAVTPGTDAYVFLVRALRQAGLSLNDVKVVPLQHHDGKNELMRDRVDAWVGLDPIMAQVEHARQARFIYRNPDFCSIDVICVRKAFGADHPGVVTKVLAAYESARLWAKEHPDEFQRLVASESNVDLPVARLMLQRTGLNDNALTAAHRARIVDAAKDLQQAGLIDRSKDMEAAVSELLNTTYFDHYSQRKD